MCSIGGSVEINAEIGILCGAFAPVLEDNHKLLASIQFLYVENIKVAYMKVEKHTVIKLYKIKSLKFLMLSYFVTYRLVLELMILKFHELRDN